MGHDDYPDYDESNDDSWRQYWDERDELLRWFHDCFFDPEDEKRRGIVRSYRWPHGAEIDPADVLINRFRGTVSNYVINEVARELKASSAKWCSRPDEIIQGEGTQIRTPLAGAHSQSDNNEESARTELLAKLAKLEILVAELQYPVSAYNHNNPPESLDELPATKRDIKDLTAAIDALRIEALSEKPQVPVLQREGALLAAFAEKVLKWGAARGTKFVDAALDAGGKTTGAAFVLCVSGLLPSVFDVVAAVEKFVQSLNL